MLAQNLVIALKELDTVSDCIFFLGHFNNFWVNINTDNLKVMAVGSDLSETKSPAPPAPDTTHLSMGEVGEDIPTLKTDIEPLSPDTSAIGLSPPGGDFSDCAPPSAPEPDLDLSELELSPSGADMLDENYRTPESSEAPATDHIKLEKP